MQWKSVEIFHWQWCWSVSTGIPVVLSIFTTGEWQVKIIHWYFRLSIFTSDIPGALFLPLEYFTSGNNSLVFRWNSTGFSLELFFYTSGASVFYEHTYMLVYISTMQIFANHVDPDASGSVLFVNICPLFWWLDWSEGEHVRANVRSLVVKG